MLRPELSSTRLEQQQPFPVKSGWQLPAVFGPKTRSTGNTCVVRLLIANCTAHHACTHHFVGESHEAVCAAPAGMSAVLQGFL